MNSTVDETALRAVASDPQYGPNSVKYIRNLFEYAACAMAMPFELAALDANKDTLGGEAYREARQELDRNRTSKHESAISSLATLNRMAEKLNLTPVYTGNPLDDHRGDVAHAIFTLCKHLLDEDDYGAGWTSR